MHRRLTPSVTKYTRARLVAIYQYLGCRRTNVRQRVIKCLYPQVPARAATFVCWQGRTPENFDKQKKEIGRRVECVCDDTFTNEFSTAYIINFICISCVYILLLITVRAKVATYKYFRMNYCTYFALPRAAFRTSVLLFILSANSRQFSDKI